MPDFDAAYPQPERDRGIDAVAAAVAASPEVVTAEVQPATFPPRPEKWGYGWFDPSTKEWLGPLPARSEQSASRQASRKTAGFVVRIPPEVR